MSIPIDLPICVYEIETGDISIYDSVDKLINFIEEFLDILENDFKIWDKNGFSLYFDKFSLKNKELFAKRKKFEEKTLRNCLKSYINSRNFSTNYKDTMNLLDIFNLIKSDINPPSYKF